MQKLVTVLLILGFILPIPAYAGSDMGTIAPDLRYTPPESSAAFDKVQLAGLDSADFIPVERKLIDEQKSGGQKKSNWWKWALGIVVVGALAAGGGGGGGGGSSSTGTVNVGW
jgi:hypothetical protein